jgi:hypothetical protein
MTSSTSAPLSAATAASPLAPASGSRRFGRFVLQELLGRSTLTMAWLAHDTRSRCDVLLMLPRTAPDVHAMPRWMEGARRSARLQHPRLVPVADIGVEDRWPFVACEFAQGMRTLGQHVASMGTPPPLEVAAWCSDALEGLAYAHEAGVAHGDLGLHSLAIDANGRIAVWGFGAAAAETAVPGGATLDPSQLRALRDEAAVDVMHAGMVLHGLLAGEPALGEADIGLAVARLPQELVRLPWTLPHPVPEALRAIVNRATDRHEQRRYLSARGLLRALSGWRQAQADDKGGALALLIDRLATVGHLPARPGLAQRVAQLSRMESQRLDELADVVLQDPALAFELLRTINSAQFHAQSEGVITTVRRAMQLIGLNGVRRAASALRAWPGPLREAGARALEQGLPRGRIPEPRRAGCRIGPAGRAAAAPGPPADPVPLSRRSGADCPADAAHAARHARGAGSAGPERGCRRHGRAGCGRGAAGRCRGPPLGPGRSPAAGDAPAAHRAGGAHARRRGRLGAAGGQLRQRDAGHLAPESAEAGPRAGRGGGPLPEGAGHHAREPA